MVSPQILTLLAAGSVITILHAMGPDHWLPHVTVSKAQGWSLGRTLRVTLLAAGAHVGLTLGLGVAILFLVLQVEVVPIALASGVMAIVLAVLGLLFIARDLLQGDHRHRRVMSDTAATALLLFVAAVPPCYAILPLFLAASAVSVETALVLLGLFGALTVATMLTLVVVGRKGYSELDRRGFLHRLETRQNLIIGIVFLFLALVIWLLP